MNQCRNVLCAGHLQIRRFWQLIQRCCKTALMGMVNLTFAGISMFFVDKMGRKPLMIIGSVGM